MWIAKPIEKLTPLERDRWLEIEGEFPLAQTLGWALASNSLTPTFLIFSPDERVGGFVYSKDVAHFECTNGPCLNWNDRDKTLRQLATFATAVSRLTPQFLSLKMRPRLNKGYRLNLPVAISSVSRASTQVISIDTPALMFSNFEKRLQRTLKKAWAGGIQTHLEPLAENQLSLFQKELSSFSEAKGFSIPPLPWFKALFRGPLSLWKGRASYGSNLAEILVCVRGNTATYLFGYEKRESLKACLSLSAAAQWEALLSCHKQGLSLYDLGGHVIQAEKSHPYHGVAQFKKQFSGNLIEYECPELIIT